MPDSQPATPSRAVFLSYAREDAIAASSVAEALRGVGIEVWLDQSELDGGDQWDAKIRGQIGSCALFVPLISAHTQARQEGYFRLEWKLAAQRTHMMSQRTAFLVPVVIDSVGEAEADVPVEFRAVQWTRLPGGVTPAAFPARVKRLLLGPVGPIEGTRSPVVLSDAPDVIRRPRRSFLLPVILAVGLLALGLWVALRPGRSDSATTTPGANLSPEKSVAVLAFSDLSPQKDGEYFSDGISEELLNVLAKVPGLRVAARTSAFFFKGKNVPIPEIAQKLNVAYVVEGSVQRAGDHVRITAQLIKAADGYHVWSDHFDRELKNVFSLQDEIAGIIAHNLRLKLSPAPHGSRVVDPEAHRLVLEARYFWNKRTSADYIRAEEAVVKAISLDPKFAQAHAGLADVCIMRAAYRLLDGATEATADTARANTAARRAVELDPTLADPYAALGYLSMVEGRYAESELFFEKAFALNPNYAVAHGWFANLRGAQGRLDEALIEYQKSMELDPLWVVNLGTYASMLGFAGRHQESLAMTDRAAAVRPQIFLPSLSTRGLAYLALGRNSEAIEVARLILKHSDLSTRWHADSAAIWILSRAGVQAGLKESADEVFRRLPEGSYQRGFVFAALGRFDEALPFLAQTPSRVKHRLYWDAMWDPWRSDPRFLELMRKLDCAREYEVARETVGRMLRERTTRK